MITELGVIVLLFLGAVVGAHFDGFRRGYRSGRLREEVLEQELRRARAQLAEVDRMFAVMRERGATVRRVNGRSPKRAPKARR